jgi:hypothetical protein
MLGLIIPLFGLLAAGCALLMPWARRPDPVGLRGALVLGIVATGLWTVAGTEALSLFRALRLGPVLAWWLAGCASLALALLANRRVLLEQVVISRSRDPGLLVMAGFTGLMLAATLWLASSYPTTTTDCWIYHLPRQYAWIRQASVDHYPAHHLHQLEMAPFAEYLGVHWMLLTGGDGWTNMHQWFALLGAVLASSLAARELGAGARGQALAGMLVLLNPAALTQAVNGKNDLVVALWVLTLGWLAARAWRTGMCGVGESLFMGAVLGLALLTKGTAYVIAAPLCLAVAFMMLRIRRAHGIALGVWLAVVVISLNAGNWLRNQQTFGWPLGLRSSIDATRISALSPAIVTSGVIKSIATQASTPSAAANAAIVRGVEAVHSALGLEVNDERTTLLKPFPFELRWRIAEDGNCSSPVHVVIAILLPAIALARWRGARQSPGLVALVLPYATFALYAGLMRWQPWQHRLEIPILSMLAPIAGCLLPRSPARALNVPLAIAGAVLACSNLALNRARPLLGPQSVLRASRDEALFVPAPHLQAHMTAIADEIRKRGAQRVGHALLMSPLEYPLLWMCRRRAPDAEVYPLNPNFGPKYVPPPDLAVALDMDRSSPLPQYRTGAIYVPMVTFGPLTLLNNAERDQRMTFDAESPFRGWRQVTGMGREEGPYPAVGLPLVRWGIWPKSALTFTSRGGTVNLEMECRRNDRPEQTMIVRLNGAEVHRQAFDEPFVFTPLLLKLETKPGLNELELEYGLPAEKNRRAVLFRVLRLATQADPP